MNSALTKSRSFLNPHAWQKFLVPYLTVWRSSWDIYLTVGSIIWFLVCTYIVCLANSAVDRINPNSLLPPDQRQVLQDPLLQWSMRIFVTTGLPNDLSDIWVRVATALLLIRAITMKRLSMTVLRRILFIAGFVYLIRAPTVVLTVLPNPYIECISNPHPNLFIDALDLMLQRRYSCGDVFFSGHSIFITLVARVYGMYTNNIFIHILAWAFTLAGLFSLVFTTYHYSIDVLFAFSIVTTLFSIWHWIAKGKMGLNHWWGHVILYLDGERIMDQLELNSSRIPFSVSSFVPTAAIPDSIPLTTITAAQPSQSQLLQADPPNPQSTDSSSSSTRSSPRRRSGPPVGLPVSRPLRI